MLIVSRTNMLRLVIAKPPTVPMPTVDLRKNIGQDWSIERIARQARPPTWEKVFEESQHELKDVSDILAQQEQNFGPYYPLKKDIFNTFWLTKLPDVKIVILGQDPYHQTIAIDGQTLPRAVGLPFSVRREDVIPSSLKNMHTELANTVRGFIRPDHGDLTEWTTQGVLLLNAALTVRPNKAGSHGDIWLGLISKVFNAIAIANPYCIYILLGKEAQKVKPMLGQRSIILEAAHPSGLSANRGFFGSDLFNLANKHLLKLGKAAVNWRISTLAELNNPVQNIVNNSPVPERKLVPVNTNEFPAYMPPRAYPTHLPVTPALQGLPVIPPLIETHTQSTPTDERRRMLPVIPNVRSADATYKVPNIQPAQPALAPTMRIINNSTPVYR